MLKTLFSLVYLRETTCPICKESDKIADYIMCRNCRESLVFLKGGLDLQVDYLDRAYCRTFYNQKMRQIIQDFKFHEKPYLYRVLGDLMVESILEEDLRPDLIVPVPMYPRKKNRRGYNQAYLLAKRISQVLSIELAGDLIEKFRNTKSQVAVASNKRTTNLRDSIRIKNPKNLEGKRLILVDDVITTGSTLDECCRVLKALEPREIIGLGLSTASFTFKE